MRSLVIALSVLAFTSFTMRLAAAGAHPTKAAADATLREALPPPEWQGWNGAIGELAPGAVITSYDGAVITGTNLGAHWYGPLFVPECEDCMVETMISAKVGKLVTSVDPAQGIGSFHGELHITVHNAQTVDDIEKFSLRMSGALVHHKGRWKIGSLFLSEPVRDKVLIETAARNKLSLATSGPTLKGDKQLSKAIAEWFSSGFASHAARGTKLHASGTAPGELKTDAAAIKLAQRWDRLKLVPTSIDAHVFGSGTIGFVRAEVQLPLAKHPGRAAPLVLGAIVIKSGEAWTWVVLDYATPIREQRARR